MKFLYILFSAYFFPKSDRSIKYSSSLIPLKHPADALSALSTGPISTAVSREPATLPQIVHEMASSTEEQDLKALETEVARNLEILAQLKTRRAILQSQQNVPKILGRSTASINAGGKNMFSVVEPENEQLNNLRRENLHRLTGITAFEIKQIPKGFGIRFEIFGSNKSFAAPHYIIFQKDPKDRLRIHRHTIPAFVPLNAIARKYLHRDLLLFVTNVKRCLNQYQMKRHLFLGKLPFVQSVEVDQQFRLVKLLMTDRVSTIMLVCSQDEIESAIVVYSNSNGSTENQWAHDLKGPLESFIGRLRAFWSSR